MDIKLISNDIELQSKFTETKYFGNVDIDNSLKFDKKYKCILVSDKLIPFSNFVEQLTSKNINNTLVFYMLSGYPDSRVKNYTSILKAKGVLCVPPKLTSSQIVERVCKEIGVIERSNKNIAVLFGADSKVGVTMTSQAIAETIAKNSETTVGLLFLNGKPSTEYIKADKLSSGIDKLKVKIINNVLSANELIDSCTRIDNLYILPGAEQISDVRHYHPEHIENLINLATKVFGIVIIDSGSRLDNGLSIGSLSSSSYKFLVTTQGDAASSNFKMIKEQVLDVLDINTSEFNLIINKYISSNQLYSPSDLADTVYNISPAGIIPYVDSYWQAERDKNSLLSYNITEYNRQIVELAKLITSQMGIGFNHIENKKKKLFGIF